MLFRIWQDVQDLVLMGGLLQLEVLTRQLSYLRLVIAYWIITLFYVVTEFFDV